MGRRPRIKAAGGVAGACIPNSNFIRLSTGRPKPRISPVKYVYIVSAPIVQIHYVFPVFISPRHKVKRPGGAKLKHLTLAPAGVCQITLLI